MARNLLPAKPQLIVDRVLHRDANLTVEVTRRPESFDRAVTITRTRRDGRRSSFTLFPRELDDIIEALADGADLLVGPE